MKIDLTDITFLIFTIIGIALMIIMLRETLTIPHSSEYITRQEFTRITNKLYNNTKVILVMVLGSGGVIWYKLNRIEKRL